MSDIEHSAADAHAVTEETIRVASGIRDAKGHKLDPEEQPLQKLMPAPSIHVAMGVANPEGGHPIITKHLQAPVTIASVDTIMSVNEYVTGYLRQCHNCENFDREGWLRIKKAAERSNDKDKMQELNGIRAALLETNNVSIRDRHQGDDGDIDVEHALNSIGLCRALSDEILPNNGNEKADIFVYPTASCPEGYSHLFVPLRSRQGRKDAASGYDALMRMAQGKKGGKGKW